MISLARIQEIIYNHPGFAAYHPWYQELLFLMISQKLNIDLATEAQLVAKIEKALSVFETQIDPFLDSIIESLPSYKNLAAIYQEYAYPILFKKLFTQLPLNPRFDARAKSNLAKKIKGKVKEAIVEGLTQRKLHLPLERKDLLLAHVVAHVLPKFDEFADASKSLDQQMSDFEKMILEALNKKGILKNSAKEPAKRVKIGMSKTKIEDHLSEYNFPSLTPEVKNKIISALKHFKTKDLFVNLIPNDNVFRDSCMRAFARWRSDLIKPLESSNKHDGYLREFRTLYRVALRMLVEGIGDDDNENNELLSQILRLWLDNHFQILNYIEDSESINAQFSAAITILQDVFSANAPSIIEKFFANYREKEESLEGIIIEYIIEQLPNKAYFDNNKKAQALSILQTDVPLHFSIEILQAKYLAQLQTNQLNPLFLQVLRNYFYNGGMDEINADDFLISLQRELPQHLNAIIKREARKHYIDSLYLPSPPPPNARPS